MKNFLLNRKSLIKFGKWSFALISLVLITYFIFNYILLALATINADQTYINTSVAGDKISANGTEESFNFTITLSAGNVSQINITVPGNLTGNFANITIENSTAGKIPSINASGTWSIFYDNYSADTRPRNITFNLSAEGGAATGSIRINLVGTPKIPDTIDNATQAWNITLKHNSSSSGTGLDFTTVYTFVDSNPPRFGTTIPLNNSYIKGTGSQNFTVTVTDLHLNTSNVTVTFDVNDLQHNRTFLTCTGSGAGGYGCSEVINLATGTWQVAQGDTVNFYFNGTDTGGNVGSNGTATSKLKVTVDKTAPQYGNITMPGNRTYAPGISYTFNATWTDNYLLDTVLIEHNFTGTATNYSVTTNTSSNFSYTFTGIPAGAHQVRWFANDSVTPLSDNNGQRNVTPLQWISISTNTSTANFLNIKLNGTSTNNTYTYPAAVNATGFKVIDEGRVTLYRNGTNVTANGSSTNEAMNETLLGNATWNFTVYYPATQNYSEAQNTTYAFVNKGTVTLTLTLNGTEANRSYTYNTAVNATGNKSTTVGSAFNITLLRNGVLVASSLTADSISENIVLGNATYNYTLIFNGSANYSDTSISDNRFALVNKGNSLVVLYLNGSTTNFTVATGQGVNITGTTNNTQGNITLWRNSTLYNSSTSLTQIENFSTYSGHPNQAFNITAGYAQTENFTVNQTTLYVFIENTPPRETVITTVNITNATTIGKYGNGTINITGTWIDNFNLDSHWLSTNETGSFVNTSGSKFTATNVSNVTIDPTGADFGVGETVVARVYVNDTTNNQNQTAAFQWTIDGTAPSLSSPTPANFTYIEGTSTQLFSVNVQDSTLNASNVTVQWRRRTTPELTWNRVSLNCNITSGTTYVCNNTVDLSAQSGVIEYFFNASDLSQLTATLPADPTNPFNVSIDRNPPQFTNAAANVSTLCRSCGVNISARWTDNQNLSYAVLETNETGSTLNKSAFYGSPFAFPAGASAGYTVSFNWTNSSASPGAFIITRIFANDTLGKGNVTGYLNFTIDGTIPVALYETVNTTNNTIIERGASINLTANWTDNLQLDKWWSSANGTGTFVNSSALGFATGNFSVAYVNTTGYTKGARFELRIYANDTSDNQNSTQLYQWTIDNTSPQWYTAGTNTTNVTTVRRGASINVSANWTDDVRLSSWWAQHNATAAGTTTNTSLQSFVSTSTGNWSNYTLDTSNAIRGNGIFVRIYANDTSDNVNQSLNPYFEYIVDGTAPSSGNITTSPTSAVTYSPGVNYTFNVSWSDAIGVSKVLFEWNATTNYTDGSTGSLGAGVKQSGSDVNNYSISLYDLGVSTGNYTYRWLANDTSDNWAATATQTYNITANATNVVTLALNGTQNANLSITYGSFSLANTSWVTAASGTVTLYRNGTSVTSAENNTAIRLGFGDHAYKANSTGNVNYSANATGVTLYALVNKGSISLNLTLNGTNANNSYTYPAAVNATAWKNATTGSVYNISLYRDGVIVATSTSVDAISENIRLANATYNYTVVFNGSTNYTDTSITTNRFALVNKGPITITLNESTQTITYGTSLTQYCTSSNADFRCSLWRNSTAGDSNVTSAENNTAITWGAGGIIYKANVTAETANYSWTEQTATITISKGATNITVLLNNNATNITIEQGVNANFTATINTSYSVTFNLTVNITGWGTKGNTSTSLQNITATGGVTAATYNVTSFFDSDQNFSSTSRSLFLTISADATGPTVLLFEYTNGTAKRAGTSLTLNVSVTDSGVGQVGNVNVTIGGSSAGSLSRIGSTEWYNGTVTIPALSDGNQTIILNISDTLNNVGTNNSFVVTIDSTPPVITITLPTNNTYTRINVSTFIWINGTVSDNIAMGTGNVSANNTNFGIFNFTGSNNTNFNVRNSSAISDGKIAVRINYSDNAGNVQNATIEWFEDDTAPSAANGLKNSTYGKYQASSSQVIEVRLTDALQTNGTVTLNYRTNTNDTWLTKAMTGTPGTSTVYTVTVDTSRLTSDNQFLEYYVSGVDNATNSITAAVGGSASSSLANVTIDFYCGNNGTSLSYCSRNELSTTGWRETTLPTEAIIETFSSLSNNFNVSNVFSGVNGKFNYTYYKNITSSGTVQWLTFDPNIAWSLNTLRFANNSNTEYWFYMNESNGVIRIT